VRFVDSLKERFKLLAVKWNGFVSLPIADEDSWFLDVFYSEGFARQRGQESGIRGELLDVF
jgi:hypothetical protein